MTKNRILDAAERLFAEHGFDATSLRDITAEAGVNLASANYHFRSKEALILAVFARRLGPLNTKRLEMLDRAEADAGDAAPCLTRVIEAMVRPVLEMRGSPFLPLFGRVYASPGPFVRDVLGANMTEIARRFTQAFRRALPDI